MNGLLWLATTALASPFTDQVAAHPPVAHPEPAYHFAAEVYSRIAAAEALAPGVIVPERIGSTIENRPIWAFAVRDPATPVTARLLLIANIHAMEWIPTEDALAFLLDYAAHPVGGVEVDVVPIVNADGRARVEGDLLNGRNLYRRGNAAHVDLNRDWAVNRDSHAIWKALLPGRYATSPSALSQPETQAIDGLLSRDAPDLSCSDPAHPARNSAFDGFLSLHSFGGFIYYPWAGRWHRPDEHAGDWRRYQQIGEAMEAAMGAHAYRPRQLSRWGFFFRGQGMELDHVYGTYGIPAFLVETTRSGLERPADLHTYFRWYNPRDPARHVRAGVDMLRAWVTATINNP